VTALVEVVFNRLFADVNNNVTIPTGWQPHITSRVQTVGQYYSVINN